MLFLIIDIFKKYIIIQFRKNINEHRLKRTAN